LSTRALAAEILIQVVHQGQSLTSALESRLPGLPGANDRAFVQALCYGVSRWYWRLEKLLTLLTRKPIKDERIHMLALLGLYQLRYMRVKPHAAVGETVASAGPRSWAKPLLNGVLRSYQRGQTGWEARCDEDETAALAHPGWLTECLRRDWPDRYRELLANNNGAPPLTLRVNRRRLTRERYVERLENEGIMARTSESCPSALTLEQALPVEAIPGFAEGDVSVQDGAAQFAADLMDLGPGLGVLDLCAAPGGKTAHLLETCPDLGALVAVDVSAERLCRVRENLDRLGLDATLIAGDATRPADWWEGRPFDRILVDAPCSGTGVIRRRPDIKLLRQPNDIPQLARNQQRILDAAWSLLAPDGQLLYATCSVLHAENEETIGRFLACHADARELPIDAGWGIPVRHGRQILTGMEGFDGFYYARLEKSA
jgi:16S rRNA (cytosine967-C5)-methyltransferase